MAKAIARKAMTADAYYDAVPAQRKPAMLALRRAISKALPKGFEECVQYGMPGWVVPLKLYPPGYHCAKGTPLPFCGVASQKGYISFYHMGMYADPKLLAWFTKAWAERVGTRLDMGKSCVRFKRPEDVPVELIADLCSKVSPKQWIARYEACFRKGSGGAKGTAARTRTRA